MAEEKKYWDIKKAITVHGDKSTVRPIGGQGSIKTVSTNSIPPKYRK